MKDKKKTQQIKGAPHKIRKVDKRYGKTQFSAHDDISEVLAEKHWQTQMDPRVITTLIFR